MPRRKTKNKQLKIDLKTNHKLRSKINQQLILKRIFYPQKLEMILNKVEEIEQEINRDDLIYKAGNRKG